MQQIIPAAAYVYHPKMVMSPGEVQAAVQEFELPRGRPRMMDIRAMEPKDPTLRVRSERGCLGTVWEMFGGWRGCFGRK